ncbi:hypothetical protein QOT17_014992 [Balamuthia mandrillaris]
MRMADKKEYFCLYRQKQRAQKKRQREKKEQEEQQQQEEARRNLKEGKHNKSHQNGVAEQLLLQDLQQHCRELEGKLQKRKNTIIQQQQTIEELSQQLEKQREREGKEEKEREPLLQLINWLIELCKSMNQNNPLQQ